MVRGSYFVLLSLFACFLASAVSVLSGPKSFRGHFSEAAVSEPASSILDSHSAASVAVVDLPQADSTSPVLAQQQGPATPTVADLQDDKPADAFEAPETAAAGPAGSAPAEVVQQDAPAAELPASTTIELSSELPESIPASDYPGVTNPEAENPPSDEVANEVGQRAPEPVPDPISYIQQEEQPSSAAYDESPQPETASADSSANLEAIADVSPEPEVTTSDPSSGPQAAIDASPNPEPDSAGEAAPEVSRGTVVPGEVVVHTDYDTAMKEAAEDGKLLLIYFHDRQPNAAQRAFEKETLGDVTIREQLKRFVFLKMRRDAQISVAGKPITLLKHPSFAEMLGRQGVAILDLAHPRAEYYGHVVSTFPFTPGKYYRKQALSIILDLPPGTLTQRTMIYAVRIHPEAPASTQGQFHAVLADEAKQHAKYQAAVLVQGHHSWDSRFHRINSKLPGGVLAQEVVAESWPNESLVEACIDCVDSWRHSPGHWGAVRSRHPLFGYDIKRGRNGIWYATGIFGRR